MVGNGKRSQPSKYFLQFLTTFLKRIGISPTAHRNRKSRRIECSVTDDFVMRMTHCGLDVFRQHTSLLQLFMYRLRYCITHSPILGTVAIAYRAVAPRCHSE